MILESRDVTVTRTGARPLHFPDLRIEKGARTLLLGPSGCRKTTLLSILAGLLHPTTGDVLLDGKDFYAMTPSARDHLRGRMFGFVFQTLHLLPSLTLRQNIALAANMVGFKQDSQRIETLISDLDLSEKSHRKPAALSQGEQQRAAIARAVVLSPAIILADEPTSALDDANTNSVMDILERQADNTGAALLIATHDSRLINRFDHVVHLESAMRVAA